MEEYFIPRIDMTADEERQIYREIEACTGKLRAWASFLGGWSDEVLTMVQNILDGDEGSAAMLLDRDVPISSLQAWFKPYALELRDAISGVEMAYYHLRSEQSLVVYFEPFCSVSPICMSLDEDCMPILWIDKEEEQVLSMNEDALIVLRNYVEAKRVLTEVLLRLPISRPLVHEHIPRILRDLNQFSQARASYITWQGIVADQKLDITSPEVTATEDRHRLALDARLRGLRLLPSQVDSISKELQAMLTQIKIREDKVLLATDYVPRTEAMDYKNEASRAGIDIHDLVAEGRAELQRLIKTFDYRRGLRFSTYAFKWVTGAIRRSLETMSGAKIKIPSSQRISIAKILQAKADYQAVHGEKAVPTLQILSKLSGIPEAKVVMLLEATSQVVSLDTPISAERAEGETLGSIIADQRSSNPAESLVQKDYHDEVERLWKTLPQPHRDILAYCDGLYGYEVKTKTELSKIYGKTESRIGQIRKEAFQHLKMKVKSVMKLKPLEPDTLSASTE